jgi:hypothetical protein
MADVPQKNVVLTKEIIEKIKKKLETLEGKEIEAGKLHFNIKSVQEESPAMWSVTYST